MAKDENEKRKVKVKEKVTVYSVMYATDANKSKQHVAPGEPMEVHPELAKKLIKQGKATEKAPKA